MVYGLADVSGLSLSSLEVDPRVAQARRYPKLRFRAWG
jgi:hypothetical protein